MGNKQVELADAKSETFESLSLILSATLLPMLFFTLLCEIWAAGQRLGQAHQVRENVGLVISARWARKETLCSKTRVSKGVPLGPSLLLPTLLPPVLWGQSCLPMLLLLICARLLGKPLPACCFMAPGEVRTARG